MRLRQRLEALEGGPSHGLKPWQDRNWKPWHRIIAAVGETEEQAIARYEAEHGPLGDDSCFIIRFIV